MIKPLRQAAKNLSKYKKAKNKAHLVELWQPRVDYYKGIVEELGWNKEDEEDEE